jgi:ribokinase
MKNIVVVGSLNMDLVTQTERVPVMGETLTGTAFKTVCGGKGGNQAFAAARLGGKVTMLGCVGNDVFGKELIRSLSEQGIDCEHISVCEGTESGTASITVCDGDNSIIIIPGANGLVSVDYVKENETILKEADFIVLQLEIPLATVEYLVDFASVHDIPVMLNPAPAQKLSDELLKKVAYMIVNETECEFFTGEKVTTVEDAKKGIALLKEKGIRHAIVTLGSQGAVYDMGEEVFHEPARKVKAVDSTAAGDTFTAGIVVSLLEGKEMSEAIRFATVASSITVTRMGAQTSIPGREEVESEK